MEKINFKKAITEYYDRLKSVMDTLNYDEIDEAMNVINNAYKSNAKIYICGNGGSAATASHIMNDFNKGICYDLEKKFNFICINDNIATIMAIANDDSYDVIFSKQLEGKINKDDILIAISGSGNSRNIIKAAEYAKLVGCRIIGMSGFDGGKLYSMSDYHLHANIKDMQIVEDVHMSFDHMMMKIFCNLFINDKLSGGNL